jgi:hypothetical protein
MMPIVGYSDPIDDTSDAPRDDGGPSGTRPLAEADVLPHITIFGEDDGIISGVPPGPSSNDFLTTRVGHFLVCFATFVLSLVRLRRWSGLLAARHRFVRLANCSSDAASLSECSPVSGNQRCPAAYHRDCN